jgi:CubicO group peptidase (beta-lactamase class C family)
MFIYRRKTYDNMPTLEDVVAKKARKFLGNRPTHGCVIGIYKNEKIWCKGFGTRTKNDSTTPDCSSIFQLASLSKLLTASTLQILHDQSALSLDDTLEKTLGSDHKLSPKTKAVTLRQLATHTSGFPGIPKSMLKKIIQVDGIKHIMHNPYRLLNREEVFDYLENPVGLRNPGRFKYSNYGMGLLGHVLEHVTKQSLESLIHTTLLQPIGMHDTAITLSPDMREQLAPGHNAKGEPASLWTCGALEGAGAFNSCANDMLKFIAANLDDRHALFSSLNKTHQKQARGKTGIGWMQPSPLDRLSGNSSFIWHDGRVGGYASYLAISPATRTGLILLTNKSVESAFFGIMLARAIRRHDWK